MVKTFCLLLVFMGFETWSLSLEQILNANDAKSLKSSVQQHKSRSFLKILCEKQKEKQRPPTACYEISLNADFLVLSLKVKGSQAVRS